MGNDKYKYSGSKILLVEGKQDWNVIDALCKKNEINNNLFGINECEGYENVIKKLNALILSSDNKPEVIGVVIDADNSSEKRWNQIKKKLKSHNYILPKNPEAQGTIIQNYDNPKIGIWLMPNNSDCGMLENFLLKMINPEYIEVAKSCVDLAKEKGITSFKENHYSKAVIHTYLAWQDEPGMPLGRVVSHNTLKHDIEIAGQFVDWLKSLYN